MLSDRHCIVTDRTPKYMDKLLLATGIISGCSGLFNITAVLSLYYDGLICRARCSAGRRQVKCVSFVVMVHLFLIRRRGVLEDIVSMRKRNLRMFFQPSRMPSRKLVVKKRRDPLWTSQVHIQLANQSIIWDRALWFGLRGYTKAYNIPVSHYGIIHSFLKYRCSQCLNWAANLSKI